MKFPITSIQGQVKKKGWIKQKRCPYCFEQVPMFLLQTNLTPKVYHIPTIAFKKRLFAVCTNCGNNLSVHRKMSKY